VPDPIFVEDPIWDPLFEHDEACGKYVPHVTREGVLMIPVEPRGYERDSRERGIHLFGGGIRFADAEDSREVEGEIFETVRIPREMCLAQRCEEDLCDRGDSPDRHTHCSDHSCSHSDAHWS
jgi:hypothetical protein